MFLHGTEISFPLTKAVSVSKSTQSDDNSSMQEEISEAERQDPETNEEADGAYQDSVVGNKRKCGA
jgi:hypothetical protein